MNKLLSMALAAAVFATSGFAEDPTLTIQEGGNLNVNKTATITNQIVNGGTITVAEGSTLTASGGITNNKTINLNGNIDGTIEQGWESGAVKGSVVFPAGTALAYSDNTFTPTLEELLGNAVIKSTNGETEMTFSKDSQYDGTNEVAPANLATLLTTLKISGITYAYTAPDTFMTDIANASDTPVTVTEDKEKPLSGNLEIKSPMSAAVGITVKLTGNHSVTVLKSLADFLGTLIIQDGGLTIGANGTLPGGKLTVGGNLAIDAGADDLTLATEATVGGLVLNKDFTIGGSGVLNIGAPAVTGGGED